MTSTEDLLFEVRFSTYIRYAMLEISGNAVSYLQYGVGSKFRLKALRAVSTHFRHTGLGRQGSILLCQRYPPTYICRSVCQKDIYSASPHAMLTFLTAGVCLLSISCKKDVPPGLPYVEPPK